MKIQSLFTPLVKRAASLFLTARADLLFQAAVVQPAFAHHITYSATAVCTNGAAFINYTPTCWDPTNSGAPGDGENPAINVTFDGVTVDMNHSSHPRVTPSRDATVAQHPPHRRCVGDHDVVWGDGFDPGGDAHNTNVVTRQPSPRTVLLLLELVASPAVESKVSSAPSPLRNTVTVPRASKLIAICTQAFEQP